MKFFIAAALLLLGAHVFAEPSPVTGEYACNRINDYSLRAACLQSVYSAYYVDQYAAGTCDRYTDANATLACMQIIVDRSFQYNALVACDRYTDANETNNCLMSIANKTFYESEVENCDRLDLAEDTTQCFWQSGRGAYDYNKGRGPRPPRYHGR